MARLTTANASFIIVIYFFVSYCFIAYESCDSFGVWNHQIEKGRERVHNSMLLADIAMTCTFETLPAWLVEKEQCYGRMHHSISDTNRSCSYRY
jgi:hypothetical protein